MTKVSAFWSGVPGHPVDLKPAELTSLNNATLMRHIASNDIQSAFRSSKEVIDFFGRFRKFSYNQEEFFLKQSGLHSARDEFEFNEMAKVLLDGSIVGGTGVKLSVPSVRYYEINDRNAALVSSDLGSTIHSSAHHIDENIAAAIQLLPEFLRERGIDWPGFAPRNLFVDYNKRILTLIDWEGTKFNDNPIVFSSNPIRQFKQVVDWIDTDGMFEGYYNTLLKQLTGLDCQKASMNSYFPFEISAKNIFSRNTSIDKLRIYCILSFIEWVRPLEGVHALITPMEFSHMVRDLFSIGAQHVFIVVFTGLRIHLGEAALASFLSKLTSELQVVLADLGAAQKVDIDLSAVKLFVLRKLIEGLGMLTTGSVKPKKEDCNVAFNFALHGLLAVLISLVPNSSTAYEVSEDLDSFLTSVIEIECLRLGVCAERDLYG